MPSSRHSSILHLQIVPAHSLSDVSSTPPSSPNDPTAVLFVNRGIDGITGDQPVSHYIHAEVPLATALLIGGPVQAGKTEMEAKLSQQRFKFESQIGPPLLRAESDADPAVGSVALAGLMGTSLSLPAETDIRLREVTDNRLVPLTETEPTARIARHSRSGSKQSKAKPMIQNVQTLATARPSGARGRYRIR
jgi:hypothetical protein